MTAQGHKAGYMEGHQGLLVYICIDKLEAGMLSVLQARVQMDLDMKWLPLICQFSSGLKDLVDA